MATTLGPDAFSAELGAWLKGREDVFADIAPLFKKEAQPTIIPPNPCLADAAATSLCEQPTALPTMPTCLGLWLAGLVSLRNTRWMSESCIRPFGLTSTPGGLKKRPPYTDGNTAKHPQKPPAKACANPHSWLFTP
ncbi:hypothetical protein DIPPA_15172 [Diplonema papillatum]|nr:hypothetical protein DIPPA_15172 [Diplonema papillatum]